MVYHCTSETFPRMKHRSSGVDDDSGLCSVLVGNCVLCLNVSTYTACLIIQTSDISIQNTTSVVSHHNT